MLSAKAKVPSAKAKVLSAKAKVSSAKAQDVQRRDQDVQRRDHGCPVKNQDGGGALCAKKTMSRKAKCKRMTKLVYRNSITMATA